MIAEEGEIQLDFTSALAARKLDDLGQSIPLGFKVVDFLVEETARKLLIELKDPSHSGAPQSERKKFAKKMTSDELACQEIVPKARCTYCFLHLLGEDDKEMLLVLFLGLEHLAIGEELLVVLTEKIRKRLRHEATSPWKRQYVKDCVILTERTWAKFLDYPLVRKP